MSSVVILPTYNEAESLKTLLPELKQYDVRILVADASPNGDTERVAKEMGVRVIHHKGKFGRVPTILSGIAATTQENVIVMDSDGQHPAEMVPRLIEALQRADIAVPSRRVAGGEYTDFSLKRRVVSAVANLLAWPLAPRLKDRTSGAIAFRREVLNGAKLLDGFSTLTLSILVMGRYTTFEEVPYTFLPRREGESKLSPKMMLDHIAQLARLYLHKFRILRFMLVGATGTLLGLGSLFLLTDVVGLHYLGSYAISFLLSVTNNYIWNSLWTFKRFKGVPGWAKYAAIYACTLVLNMSLMYLLTSILGLWYMSSAVIVVLVVFILNYILSRRIVWRSSKAS